MTGQQFFRPVWWRMFLLDSSRTLAALVVAGLVVVPLFGAATAGIRYLAVVGVAVGSVVLLVPVAWLRRKAGTIEVTGGYVDGSTGWPGRRTRMPLAGIDRSRRVRAGFAGWVFGPQHLRSVDGEAIIVDPLTFDPATYRRLKAALEL